jgi:hypothetical protein
VVPVEDNYDRLRIPADAVTRDVRYTRYVDERRLLRSHSTAMIPAALPPWPPAPPTPPTTSCWSARGWCTGATPSTGSTHPPRASSTSGASPAGRSATPTSPRLMLRKGIPDIRLLRSADPRVAGQMADLAPWRPVSAMPPVRRDLSVVVAADDTVEDLGDRVRDALGPDADAVEEVTVLTETPYDRLPAKAVARLGVGPQQKNVLVRVVLRHLERT